MPLPEITHLQYLVLGILADSEKSGREIRDHLAKEGEKKSGPAFYQFMSRLEEAKLLEGRYDQKVVEGQIIKERRYRITGSGMRAFDDTTNFYLARRGFGLLNA
jgi:DNA-binding PadR family transcriptional regulator